MRPRWRHAVIALAALALATVLYQRSRVQGTTAYDQRVDDLRRLTEQDAAFGREVLAARYALSASYDRLVATSDAIDRIDDRLRAGSPSDAATRELGGLIEARRSALELFKSNNAVLKHSLSYLPMVLEDMEAALSPAAYRTWSDPAGALAKGLLVYGLAPGDSERARLESRIAALTGAAGTIEPAAAPSLDRFLRHARAILRDKREVDQLLPALVNRRIEAAAEAHFQIMRRAHDVELAHANRYRILLYVYVVGLLAALGWAVAQILRAKARVERLNAALEARGRELADANAQLEARLRELTQTQEQLLHSGKMAAVGTLIAGLSHELNNPIGIILGFAQSLLKRTPDSEPAHKALVAIERQAQRCGKLVRTLLDFSHQRRAAPELVAAGALLERTAELAVGPARRKSVELRFEPTGDDAPTILASVTEVESALINLVGNAIDATPAGGSVVVSARALESAGRAGLELSVVDTGCGMSQEVSARVFDPFFTTKAPGEGTGLGLSLARQIVEAHGGTIALETEVGKGTAMKIWLPAAAAQGEPLRAIA